MSTFIYGLFLFGFILFSFALFLVHRVRYPLRSNYNPSGIEGVNSPKDLDWPYEEVSIAGYDDIRLTGWFIPAKKPSKHSMLLIHGHRKNKVQMLCHAQYLRAAGYSLLLLDMRHHGASEDGPYALGVFTRWDIARVVQWLQIKEETKGNEIGVFGISIGGTAAIAAALDGVPFRCVIADSPSANQAETLADYGAILYKVPRAVSRLLLSFIMSLARIDFSPMILEERPLRDVVPLLLLHGEADSRVPLHHSERLKKLAPRGRVSLVTFNEADHVGSFAADENKYRTSVLQFLQEHLACPL